MGDLANAPTLTTSLVIKGELDVRLKTLLHDSLQGTDAEIVYPSTDGYEALIARWSETCEKRAAAVILPTSAEEVASAVAILTENGIPFVVAGGRHSTSGSSAIQDGVVLDLRKMRKVAVDAEAKTITAEGGTIWEDVDVEAAKYGLATVGGTVNHTGVGGLTLGGGSGWLSGRYGLTIDNLLSVKMVLADGSIVKVSVDSRPDLFWAVRGAGQCFGVAVEFTFQGWEQGSVWAGLVAFTPDKLAQLIDFANWNHEQPTPDRGMTLGFSTPPGASVPVVLLGLFYNGSEDDAKKYYALLFELGPVMNMCGPMPYEKVNGMLNDAMGFGGRKLFGGSNVALPLDPAFVQSVYDEFAAFASRHDEMRESVVLFEFLPYNNVLKVGVEETACANRGDYYNVATVFKWSNPELDGEVRLFNRKINARITSEAGRKKTKAVGVYANYMQVSRTPQEVFGVNTARLQELKLKYDPANVFNSWHDLLPN